MNIEQIQTVFIADIKQMAQFYSEYQADENLQPLVGEISWSKHIVILNKEISNKINTYFSDVRFHATPESITTNN